MELSCKEPWPKLRFKTEQDGEHDGYLYYILGDKYYVSQNQSMETMGLAQNWIISWQQIIKFYDEKYGLKCTCGAKGANNATHTLTCKWSTINTDLM